MDRSDVFRAIVKIQEYCNKHESCDGCDFCYIDDWDEYVCTLDGVPREWGTGEIPLNVLEEEE